MQLYSMGTCSLLGSWKYLCPFVETTANCKSNINSNSSLFSSTTDEPRSDRQQQAAVGAEQGRSRARRAQRQTCKGRRGRRAHQHQERGGSQASARAESRDDGRHGNAPSPWRLRVVLAPKPALVLGGRGLDRVHNKEEKA